MKYQLLLSLLILPIILPAQRTVTQSVPVQSGQSVELNFDYPEQVSIEIGDQPSIEIEAAVSINMGENDEAFRFNVDDAGDQLRISTEIVNREDLPERIVIRHEGQDHYFQTDDWDDPNVQAFLRENGRENIQWMSHGPDIDISVKIRVPRSIELKVNSKFGLVEMKGVTRSLTIHAKHGGLDLAVSPTTSYDFAIDCNWGEVYTDLDLDVATEGKDQLRSLRAEKFVAKLNGGGSPVTLISEHGNVYLRAM